jgi:hypothetical protein
VVARQVLGVADAPLPRGGARSAPSIPTDAPIFERGWEAIRAHRGKPRRRAARRVVEGRSGKKRVGTPARKKTAAKTRTVNPSRSSTSRSSKRRLKKQR